MKKPVYNAFTSTFDIWPIRMLADLSRAAKYTTTPATKYELSSSLKWIS